MKKTLGILVVLSLTLSIALFAGGTSPCNADDPPDIKEAYHSALNYLAGCQNADGSWGMLPERDTFLVVEAFAWSNYLYENLPEEITNSLMAYIVQLNGKNTDIISRKSFPLMLATQEELEFLSASANPDGGYALAPGLPSTPLDTSICFVGNLVTAIMSGNFETLRNNISYLKDTQENGAYPLYPDGPPDLLATASAAYAMNLFGFLSQESGFDQFMNEEIAEATQATDTFLASVQNPDGGFGEQGSTAYETAMVLQAASWSPSTSVDILAAASYLLDRRQVDGSIAGDVATTAMFCVAAMPKPYLPASALTLEKSSYRVNEPLEGTIEVGNKGILAADSLEIRIALDDPNNTFDYLTAESVPVNGTVTLPLEAHVSASPGTHQLYVSVNGFLDTNLYDNYATASFYVEPAPNFTIASTAHVPEVPQASRYVELQALVRNNGSKGAGPVDVSFYEGSDLIGTTSMEWLGGGEEALATLPEVVMAGGDHTVTVVVDADDAWPEMDETDNRSDFGFSVAYDLTIPELASPDNGSATNNTKPALSWFPASGADEISYVLETSSDPASGNWSRITGILQASDLVSYQWLSTLSNRTYWWRVRATDGLKETDPSQTRSFTVDTKAPDIFVDCTGETAFSPFSPNGDGFLDLATIRVRPSEDVVLKVDIIDADGGVVKTLIDGTAYEEGIYDIAWDGSNQDGVMVEGSFTARATATDNAGNSTTRSSSAFLSDITPPEISGFTCSPDAFTPNGDGTLDSATISFSSGEAATASLSLFSQAGENLGKVMPVRAVPASLYSYNWDGKVDGSSLGIDGTFELELTLRDQVENVATTRIPITMDISTPAMTLPIATISGDTDKVVTISVEVTGASLVRATFAGQENEMTGQDGLYTAVFPYPTQPGSYNVTVYAEDLFGNHASRSDVQLVIPNILYGNVAGDTTQSDFENGVSRENIDTENWPEEIAMKVNQQVQPPDLPNKLREAPAFMIDGKICIFGGQMYDSSGWIQDCALNQVIVYNPGTNTYEPNLQPMQQARYAAAAAQTPDGCVYIFGGSYTTLDLNEVPRNTAEVYDPSTGTWAWLPSLPHPLTRAQAGFGSDGFIYIFGGWDGETQTQTDEVLRFDPADQSQPYQVVGHLPAARCCFSMTVHNGLFYIMGGHNGDGELLDCWSFDPVAPPETALVQLASLPRSSIHGTALIGPMDCLYLFGSSGRTTYHYGCGVYRYDFDANTWKSLPMLQDQDKGRACIFAPNGITYLFGGAYSGSYSVRTVADAEAYDPSYPAETTFVSRVFQMSSPSEFGQIATTADVPEGTAVYVSTRTSIDNVTWTDWSEEMAAPGGNIANPLGKYLQYRLRFTTSDPYCTAHVFDVSFSYNLGPSWSWPTSPSSQTLATPNPTFFFSTAARATTYALEIDRSSDFSSPDLRTYDHIASVDTGSISFVLPSAEPLADGGWYWRVRGTDEVLTGPWSQTLAFAIDTTPPALLSAEGTPDPFVPDAGETWSLTASSDSPANATLKIYDSSGSLVRQLTETSSSYTTEHLFTWDGKEYNNRWCSKGSYTWEISLRDPVGNVSQAYTGTVVIAPIDLEVQAAPPTLILTDDGGELPQAALSFTLEDTSDVLAILYRGNSKVKTFCDQETLEAGTHTLTWDGILNSTCAPAGEYKFWVRAVNSLGRITMNSAYFQVEVDSTICEDMSLTESAISPNGDGALDSTGCSFTLAQAAYVDLEVAKEGVTVRDLTGGGFLLPGAYSYSWDGMDNNGNLCPDGEYQFTLQVRNRLGMENVLDPVSCKLDAHAPGLTSCLLDRVPGSIGSYTFTACFNDAPASSSLLTATGEVPLTPAGDNQMSAELSEADLAGDLVVRVADDTSNLAEYGVSAHRPAPVTTYDASLTSAEDFSHGTLEGIDGQTWPGYLSANGPTAPGSYTSEVIDLGGTYQLGTLSWLAASAPGAEASCSLIASADGIGWTSWPDGSQENIDLTGIRARYVQIRVDFPAGQSPLMALSELRLSYDPGEPVVFGLPDLCVDSMTFEPASPEVGQTVTISVNYSNQGGPAIAPLLRLYQGEEQVGYDIVELLLVPGASRSAFLNYTCTSPGEVAFTAMLDPEGAIVEADEANNMLSSALEVLPSGISAEVAVDKASYLPEEDVAIATVVRNDSERDRYLTAETYIEDADGNQVVQVSSEDLGILIPGEERGLSSSWNTGTTYSGDYQVRISVVEDGIEKASAATPFAIEPQGNLTLGATCDRISYSAGDTAGLRARVISEALNFRFSGLTVRSEVLSPVGDVISTTEQGCSDLYPGDLRDVPFAFEVGGNPAGTYKFRATVLDGEETVAVDEVAFEVKPTSADGAGVSGTLAASPKVLEQGAPFTVDYALANQGNYDLSGLPVWLLVVDPETGEPAISRELSIDLAKGASIQGTEAFSSADLSTLEGGKNWLVIMAAQFTEGANTLAFTTLKITPSSFDHLEISPIGDQTAGAPFDVEVRALSSSGTVVPYAASLSFTDTTGTLSPIQGEMVDGVFTGTFSGTAATSADAITISAGGMSVASNAFAVVPGPAASLTADQIASPQTAGVAFTLKASAYDAWGNLAVSFNEACSITDTTGTVSSSSSGFVGGALSTNITVTKAINSTMVTISAAGLTTSTNSFEVVAGPAASLTAREVASPQEAGAPFAITAQAFDAWGNPVTGFNEACTITDTTGTVSPATAGFASGVMSVNLAVTKAAVSDAVTLSAGDLSVTTNTFEVVAGPAVSLVASPVGTPRQAGASFGITVEAFDAWGNPVTGFNETCTITDTTGSVSPSSATFAGGELSADLTVTKAISSSIVTVSTGGLSVSTNAFEVVAGPAVFLSTAEVASSQQAGTPFAIAVFAYDAWGNQATGFSEACSISDATGTVSPQATSFAGGELSASISITKATSSDTVTIASGGLSVTSNSFEVKSGPAASLAAAFVGEMQQAGSPFGLVVEALDAWGNPTTGFNETCTITDTTGTASPAVANFASGLLSAQVTVTRAAAADTVTISADSLSAVTNSFEVIPGPAASLAMAEISSPQKTRIPFIITAQAFDAWGNPATGFNEDCAITDITGTVAPATAAFASGHLSVEVAVYQKLAADTITLTAADITATSNFFEVKPNVDVDMTLSVENQKVVPSVLVWTDTDANETMITEVLTASGCNYTIVRADHSHGCGHASHKAGMEDFAAEMRSGAYNTFLLLSPDHPLEDHLADEVRERVNAGAGLLLSDPKDVNHFREHPAKAGIVDLFGIKQKGNLSSDTYTVNLTDSPLSPAATLTFTGKMKKLEIDDAQVLGTVTVTKGNKTETWPALTLKQYGLGKAALVCFDFANVASADTGKAKAILANSLGALAAPASALDAGLPLPLRLDLANLAGATDVRIEVPLPSGMDFLWAEGGTFTQGSVVFDLSLAEAEQKQLDMLLLPSQPADYAFTASLSYLDQGGYVFLKEASLVVSVGGDAANLQSEAFAAIDALVVANKDKNDKSKAYDKVAGIDLTNQDPDDVDEYIEDLVKAVEYLQKIDSTDTTDARLLTDRLMIQLERNWYTLSGGGS